MKKTIFDRLSYIVNIVVLLLFALLTFYPFYYVFIYSISIPGQAIRGGVYFLPKGLSLMTYMRAFQGSNILNGFFISTLRTIVGTLFTLVGCSMFAFGITKEILPFRKTMYRLSVVTMYVSSGLIPWYITMRAYGLKNNFLLYVLPSILVPFFVILIKTYFESIPPSIEESAMIDGAGYFTVYRRIILPISMPILATVALFAAVGQWNSWTDNLYLCPSPMLETLQLILFRFLQSSLVTISSSGINDTDMKNAANSLTPSSVRMTITMIATLPILCVYPFVQRFFIKGIMIGAVKG